MQSKKKRQCQNCWKEILQVKEGVYLEEVVILMRCEWDQHADGAGEGGVDQTVVATWDQVGFLNRTGRDSVIFN